MSIEICCDGDKCRSKDLKVFYCEDCYTALGYELEKANQIIRDLEEKIESLQKG